MEKQKKNGNWNENSNRIPVTGMKKQTLYVFKSTSCYQKLKTNAIRTKVHHRLNDHLRHRIDSKRRSRQLGYLCWFRFQHQSNEQLPRWHFLLRSIQSRVQHRHSREPLQARKHIASARIVWLDRLCRSFPENNWQWSSVQRAHSRLAQLKSILAKEGKFYRSRTWFHSVRPHYKCDVGCSSCY